MNSLTDALLQGRKIEAIKLLRQLTGLGLKESKDALDEMEASLRAKFPEKFSARPKSAGCAGSAAIFGLGLTLLAYWVTRR